MRAPSVRPNSSECVIGCECVRSRFVLQKDLSSDARAYPTKIEHDGRSFEIPERVLTFWNFPTPARMPRSLNHMLRSLAACRGCAAPTRRRPNRHQHTSAPPGRCGARPRRRRLRREGSQRRRAEEATAPGTGDLCCVRRERCACTISKIGSYDEIQHGGVCHSKHNATP